MRKNSDWLEAHAAPSLRSTAANTYAFAEKHWNHMRSAEDLWERLGPDSPCGQTRKPPDNRECPVFGAGQEGAWCIDNKNPQRWLPGDAVLYEPQDQFATSSIRKPWNRCNSPQQWSI
jgi:hypothetical protein